MSLNTFSESSEETGGGGGTRKRWRGREDERRMMGGGEGEEEEEGGNQQQPHSWHRRSGKLGFITLGGLPGDSTEGEQGKEVSRACKAVMNSDHSGYWAAACPLLQTRREGNERVRKLFFLQISVISICQ